MTILEYDTTAAAKAKAGDALLKCVANVHENEVSFCLRLHDLITLYGHQRQEATRKLFQQPTVKFDDFDHRTANGLLL